MDARFETGGEENREYQSKRKLRSQSAGRKQLRIVDILHVMRKHIILIAICAGVGLVLGVALSVVSYMRGEMSKQYAISTSIAVAAQNSNGMYSTESRYPSTADMNLAADMVDSVIYVMRSDRNLNAVVERLNLMGISTRFISTNLSINQYKDTPIIEITLYWRTAEEGIEILNALNEVSPRTLLETLRIGNVVVINDPTSRYIIGGSLNASMWVYMTVLGIMMGVGFAVLELLLRPTLLSVEDMERSFGVEVLGEIPERRAYFRKKRNLLLESEDDEKHTEVVDNYIYLAHILKNRLKGWEHPIVYFTSSGQNEGKTTVVAHMAVQLAELGMKTLIIDFDTRNPKLGGLFLQKVEYFNSVNALYHGDVDQESAITSLTGHLDILPAVLERRPLPYDDALLDLVRSLKQNYDVVLMDTAPVGQVADTMSLNKLADVALMVVRFDTSSMEAIRECLLRLDKSGMQVLGCVVNGVKELSSSNAGTGRSYGAHGGTRKPFRKREKTEEERAWEKWQKERSEEATLEQRLDRVELGADPEELPTPEFVAPQEPERPEPVTPVESEWIHLPEVHTGQGRSKPETVVIPDLPVGRQRGGEAENIVLPKVSAAPEQTPRAERAHRSRQEHTNRRGKPSRGERNTKAYGDVDELLSILNGAAPDDSVDAGTERGKGHRER